MSKDEARMRLANIQLVIKNTIELGEGRLTPEELDMIYASTIAKLNAVISAE